MQESVNALEIGGIVRLFSVIIRGTFIIEGIGAEMCIRDSNYVLALASVMDPDEGFDRLADALIEIDLSLIHI